MQDLISQTAGIAMDMNYPALLRKLGQKDPEYLTVFGEVRLSE